MKLIKMLGIAAIAAVAAMAFVAVTLASANTTTQLCNSHVSLVCGNAATSVHLTLAVGSVGKLLSPVGVLCLNVLVESSGADVGALAKPQRLDATSISITGCGTDSGHDNCTVTFESLPDNTLLKTGLDEGSLESTSGSAWLKCPNIGINCLYDLEGSLFAVGAQHLTANQTPTIELGLPFLCPGEGLLDGLLKTLESRYILQ